MTPAANQQWPHLSKAPINEAIIDILVELPGTVTVQQIKELHSEIAGQYPVTKERHKWEGKLEIKGGGSPSTQSLSLGIDGYLFVSTDKLQIVQFRLDGFTFSRLRPYETWERLRDEARRLWESYKKIGPISVSRIAVRYINVLDAQLPVKVEDYLAVPPGVPTHEGMSFSMGSFLSRVVATDPSGVFCIATQALEEAKGSAAARIILDIDVFRHVKLDPGDPAIWDALEGLRKVKNEVFFRNITDAVRQRCQ